MTRPTLSRRSALAGVAAVSGVLAGCIDGFARGGDDDPDVPAAGRGGGAHRLYLENLATTARVVGLTVTNVDSERRVVDGRYRLPPDKGAEFANVAHWDERYEVRADVVDGPTRTFDWPTENCGRPETDGGTLNGSVRLLPDGDGLSFVVDACDAIQAGTAVPVGPVGNYVAGSSG